MNLPQRRKREKGNSGWTALKTLCAAGKRTASFVKAGDPKHSELFRRINLPPDDKDFMPTDGKPPLTALGKSKLSSYGLLPGASSSPARN